MSNNGKFLRVKNFEKFQHYKKRNPPWIKLHSSILDDFEFNSLPETSRFHLVSIWILSSKLQNHIPFNPDFIKKRINAGKSFDLQLLIDKGFLIVEQDASIMLDASPLLADCKQSAMPETEERRGEKHSSSRTPASLEEFIETLKKNPAYQGIDIDKELAKMDLWFLTPNGKGRKKTHKFILNWMNKAEIALPIKPNNDWEHAKE